MKHKYFYILFISFIFSNNLLIKSTILTKANKPIVNANVYCGENGTRSNENGSFSLYCKSIDTLYIKHINYLDYSKTRINEFKMKRVLIDIVV